MNTNQPEIDQAAKDGKRYTRPTLTPKYEPPVLLDLEQFVVVAGNCGTGGNACT